MISLKINNTKAFMNHMLLQNTFDHFWVKEASIETFYTITIDGSRKKDFYTPEELEEANTFTQLITWAECKNICLEMMKGKKVPLSFHFVLKLSPKNTEKIISATDTALTTLDVSGLYLNISFENAGVTAITGTSLNTFTMDKSVDHAWDEMIKKFFTKHNLDYDLA